MPSAVINATGSGDNTIIAAPGANAFIRVLHYRVTADRGTTVQWKSGSSTLMDVCYATNGSGSGISTPLYEGGLFDLADNDPLVLNNSVTANVGGSVIYIVKTHPGTTNA